MKDSKFFKIRREISEQDVKYTGFDITKDIRHHFEYQDFFIELEKREKFENRIKKLGRILNEKS